MWQYTDIEDFYDRVRNLLNTDIITDTQIDYFEKAPLSELDIKSKVTNWETLQTEDTDKFSIFESCIIYHTAIKFEKYVQDRLIKSKATPSVTVQYNTSSTSTDEAPNLRKTLDYLLSQLEESESSFYYGFMVT